MNEEDLEKTRALNELTDLVNQNNNSDNAINNSIYPSNGISDTKDASEIINIPDDINGEENKEELFNDLTNDNNSKDDKKNKKSIIKKFKDWFSKLTKKQKIIFISVAVLILILLITLVIILVTRKKDEQTNNNNTPDIVLEADNYMYQNGTLTMLDRNGNTLGTYDCENKDEKKCYVAYLSNFEDDFDTPINKSSNDEIIKSRSQIYFDRYVFIYDNESENAERIKLYDMQDNKIIDSYYGVKSYNVENANAVVLKDEKDTYGLFEFNSNGLTPLINFKYSYLGLIDKEKDVLVVVKDSRGYYLVDYADKAQTKVFNKPIYDYNDNYVVLKDNNNYSIYDYKNKDFLKDYDYIRLISNDYAAVVKNKNLFIRNFEDKKYNEEGYELTNDKYRKVYTFDSERKLINTEFAFDLELHEKTLSITIKNADGSTRDEKLNLAEGDASAKYNYYSYYNGKLYFYDDENKTNLIGTYECNNKNNNITDKFNNCYVAKDNVFNDSYINPYVNKDAVIALYNKRYVFILDAPDLQNNDNKEIKFYDLTQSKVLGTYNAIDANMGQSVDNLTLVNTNDTKIIARLKSGKFGVIQIKGSDANVLQKFNYNYIERAANDYIVQLENNNWQIIYGSNNYTSSEFPGRIKNYANGYVVIKNSEKDYIYKGDGTMLLNTGYDYIDINNKTVFAAAKDSKLDIYTYDNVTKKVNTDTISLKSNKYYNTNTPAFKLSVSGNNVNVNIYNSDGTLSETKTYQLKTTSDDDDDNNSNNNNSGGQD